MYMHTVRPVPKDQRHTSNGMYRCTVVCTVYSTVHHCTTALRRHSHSHTEEVERGKVMRRTSKTKKGSWRLFRNISINTLYNHTIHYYDIFLSWFIMKPKGCQRRDRRTCCVDIMLVRNNKTKSKPSDKQTKKPLFMVLCQYIGRSI